MPHEAFTDVPPTTRFVIDASGATAAPATPLPGTSVANKFGVTGRYLTKDGVPWLPSIGEIHYLRIPSRLWADSLDRVVAGGIDVVGTYVFWNHHEETEGQYEWYGDRNLSEFLRLCHERGLSVLLRVGPFAHGEARNGALPDWLYGRGIRCRCNDPTYLGHVERYFAEVAQQVRGHLVGNGGPIIAIQIENEYEAAGAPWETDLAPMSEWVNGGGDGSAHIETLQRMLRECGLEAPFYTCTAWTRSPIPEGIVPMHSSYPVNFWSVATEAESRPNRQYVIVDRWKLPGFEDGGVAYEPETRPFLMVEMGVGMQPTVLQRPYVPPEVSDSLSRIMLASGSNTVGYYMYRGGTQMVGETFLNEGTLPRLTYDYQAPIGEFGALRESYFRLRTVHHFLHTCGALMAPMAPIVPVGAEAREPSDVSTPQYSLRSDGDSGFLFLSNFQSGVELRNFANLEFSILLRRERIAVHVPHLAAGVSSVLPINLDLGGVRLKFATAEPMDRIAVGDGAVWLFASIPGTDARFAFEAHEVERIEGGVGEREPDFTVVSVPESGGCFHAVSRGGQRFQIVIVSRERAGRTAIGEFGRGARWVESSGALLNIGPRPSLEAVGDEPVYVRCGPTAFLGCGDPFRVAAVLTRGEPASLVSPVRLAEGVFSVPIPLLPTDGSDLELVADYLGDHAYAFVDGKLVADDYTVGDPWKIRLGAMRDLPWGKTMILRFLPLVPGTHPELSIRKRRAERGVSSSGTFALDNLSMRGISRIEIGEALADL